MSPPSSRAKLNNANVSIGFNISLHFHDSQYHYANRKLFYKRFTSLMSATPVSKTPVSWHNGSYQVINHDFPLKKIPTTCTYPWIFYEVPLKFLSSSFTKSAGTWSLKNSSNCDAVPIPLLIATGSPSTNKITVGNFRKVILCSRNSSMNCFDLFPTFSAFHLTKSIFLEYLEVRERMDRSINLHGPQLGT